MTAVDLTGGPVEGADPQRPTGRPPDGFADFPTLPAYEVID
jgi:hypothetical protein